MMLIDTPSIGTRYKRIIFLIACKSTVYPIVTFALSANIYLLIIITA